MPNEPRTPNTKPVMSAWDWQSKGKCAGMDTDVFFLDDNERKHEKAASEAIAKLVCCDCPVINECLTHALSVPENYGVWGGRNPDERKTLRRQLNRQARLLITKELPNHDD